MRLGVTRVGVSKALGWLCFGLLACGGRTIDDGTYDVVGDASDDAQSGQSGAAAAGRCTVDGVQYDDGALIPGVCLCACDKGAPYCESGCRPGSGTR